MADVPPHWKPYLRKLSYGPYSGTMHRWTYHDGTTWVAILFDGEVKPERAVGWSCFTKQEEPYPVIGVYIDERHRGNGYAEELVRYLLTVCRGLVDKGCVYAVSEFWPKYTTLIESFGWRHLEWE